jgi:thiol-disulfide isomerase/thioredoxin
VKLLVLVALLTACPAPQTPKPTAGPLALAKALALIEASPDLDGKPIGGSDAHATIVILMASWCGHCKATLAQLSSLRGAHPKTRIVGVSYKPHEEYDSRGSPVQLRAYVAEHVPWLRVVPAGEPLFDALGRPPFVPAVWVYGPRGELVEFFDRREREPPTTAELEALLARLGA